MSKLGHISRNLALLFNLRVSKTTKRSDLIKFFEAIKPIRVEKLIRIGSEYDGGYLIPDDLDGITECYSPGVSFVSDFENDLTKFGIICHMADYSVDGPALKNPLFKFYKKFIGIKNDSEHIRLDDWIRQTSTSNGDMILQMDIEGAEWTALNTTPPELLKRFRIIVLEVHSMYGLFDPIIFRQFCDTFNLITSEFDVVHIHPNNTSRLTNCSGFSVPSVIEFTFLRKDRLNNKIKARTFPQELDSPNAPEKRDYPLPKCWYE